MIAINGRTLVRRAAIPVSSRNGTITRNISNILNYSKTNGGDRVRLVEVGPRDGLQNEAVTVPTDTKVEFINRLSKCGFPVIEATSFVSPKWIPQLSDNKEVMNRIIRESGTSYSVLVPNAKGLQAAVDSRSTHMFLGCSPSESFTKRNVNATVADSLVQCKALVDAGKKLGIYTRGYVSTVIGCPYEGPIKPKAVAELAAKLYEMGCDEISLGDTIGVGTAGTFNKLLTEVLSAVPVSLLALHCHDTYGQALVNILVGLEAGIRTVDSSVAGLGGCPYAKGASGNVATEDVVYLLDGLGLETGVDVNGVTDVGQWICGELRRNNASATANAIIAKRKS